MPMPSQATGSTRSRPPAGSRHRGAHRSSSGTGSTAGRRAPRARPAPAVRLDVVGEGHQAGQHHPHRTVRVVAGSPAGHLAGPAAAAGGRRCAGRCPAAARSARSAIAARPNRHGPHCRALARRQVGREPRDLGDPARRRRQRREHAGAEREPRARAGRPRRAAGPARGPRAATARRTRRAARPAGARPPASRRAAGPRDGVAGRRPRARCAARRPARSPGPSAGAPSTPAGPAAPTRASVSTLCTSVGRPSTPPTAVGLAPGRRAAPGRRTAPRTTALDSPVR